MLPSSRNATGLPPPGSLQRVVLTGFMGSGKSTIGRRLAQRLHWRFVDLDQVIEQSDGRTVATIFAESGEPAFRAKETEALLSSLAQPRIVLALGGGALETPANQQALARAPRTCTVYLTASFDTLYDRCQQQTRTPRLVAASGGPADPGQPPDASPALPVRPLLGDREAAAARLARRDPIYRQHARLILDTTGQQPQQSAEALLTLLKTL